MRDEDVRTACMAHLSVLVAEFGEDVTYAGGLARGFPFRGAGVPFLNYQKGLPNRRSARAGGALDTDLVEVAVRRRGARGRLPLRQARFRGRVVLAYRNQCAICRLKELRLLDAAHILGDVQEGGEPTVSNGLSLCAIHHRAFDQNLVGVSPDYVVHVSRRLLEDEDGPMLDLLKGSHEVPLTTPARAAHRPDRERLDARFARFLELAA